jgi:hypothetical protein
MNKTIFIGAMIAVATILGVGLAVLPSAVQEAQANPCATEVEQNTEIGDDAGTASSTTSSSISPSGNDNRECNFNGPVELDED